MVTLAIANQKGGVGKTTTAVTLAAGLAQFGRSVLLVDLDSQGNVADSLGLPPGPDLARLLSPVAPLPLHQCTVYSGQPNLDVVRSDKNTAALKSALAGADFREYCLSRALDNADHDIVILDCAPSIDVLHTAALVAADWILVPTRLDQLSIKGIRDLLVSLSEIHRQNRSACQLAGILPTFYDRTTSESQSQLDHLVKQFKRYVLPPIPTDTRCREASRLGRTLFEFDPQCRALVGVSTSGKNYGGYNQVIQRIDEVLW